MKKNLNSAWLFVILQIAFIGNLNAQWLGGSNPVHLDPTNSAFNVSIGTAGSSFKLNTTSSASNDGIEINQLGSTSASLYLNAYNGTGSGKDWGIFSTGSGNSQGAGKLLFRDIYNFADRFWLDGSTGDGNFSNKVNVADQVVVNGGSPFAPSARLTAYTKTAECFSGYSDDENTWCAVFQSKDVGALGSAGFYTGNQSQSIGLWGQAGFSSNNSHYTRTVGVHGDGYGGPYGFTAGVYGSGYGGNCGFTYGVYGDIYQGCGFAGYFDGDVMCTTGNYLGSDQKLKKNIQPLTGALEKVMQLKPSTYEYRKDEFKAMNLPDGMHYGVIAQQLEQVFPGMVREAHHPARIDEKTQKEIGPAVDFKCVNYTELIPLLIGSIQEQQSKIEALENKIAELEQHNSGNSGTSKKVQGSSNAIKGALLQNIPNPFDKTSRIDFVLPNDAQSAFIVLTDMAGAELERIPVAASNNGSVTISSANLQAGNYIYALVVNGEKVDQKQLVVIK